MATGRRRVSSGTSHPASCLLSTHCEQMILVLHRCAPEFNVYFHEREKFPCNFTLAFLLSAQRYVFLRAQSAMHRGGLPDALQERHRDAASRQRRLRSAPGRGRSVPGQTAARERGHKREERFEKCGQAGVLTSRWRWKNSSTWTWATSRSPSRSGRGRTLSAAGGSAGRVPRRVRRPPRPGGCGPGPRHFPHRSCEQKGKTGQRRKVAGKQGKTGRHWGVAFSMRIPQFELQDTPGRVGP